MIGKLSRERIQLVINGITRNNSLMTEWIIMDKLTNKMKLKKKVIMATLNLSLPCRMYLEEVEGEVEDVAVDSVEVSEVDFKEEEENTEVEGVVVEDLEAGLEVEVEVWEVLIINK